MNNQMLTNPLLSNITLLSARILVSILFLVAGVQKSGDGYVGTQQYMESMGVPGALLPLVILLEFAGGLGVVFGLLTRTFSLSLALFTLIASLIFHVNWADWTDFVMFLKNMGIISAFLLLALTGPGDFSLDRRFKKRW